MNKEWKGDENHLIVANEYSKAWHRSAAMCDVAPEVVSASQAKAAAYLAKQQRDLEGSIREIELPFECLHKTGQTKQGRTPYEYDVVLFQIDKHTFGQNIPIQRDLPKPNSEDSKKHQEKVDAAMPKRLVVITMAY